MYLLLFICLVNSFTVFTIYVYLGAGVAGVWPRCDPVVFDSWQVDEAHDHNESQELLQLISAELLPRPLLYTRAWSDGVSVRVLTSIQMCLCDNAVEHSISH